MASLKCSSCQVDLVMDMKNLCFYRRNDGDVLLTITNDFMEVFKSQKKVEINTTKIESFRSAGVRQIDCRNCSSKLGSSVPYGPSGTMLFAFGPERVLLLERKLPPSSKWKFSFADACFSKICKKDGLSYVRNSSSYAAKETSLELHERRRSRDTSSDTSNMLLHVQGGMQKLSIAAAVSHISAQNYEKMENSSSAAAKDNSDTNSKNSKASSDSKAEGSWRRQQPLPPPDSRSSSFTGRILCGEEGSARVKPQYVKEDRSISLIPRVMDLLGKITKTRKGFHVVHPNLCGLHIPRYQSLRKRLLRCV